MIGTRRWVMTAVLAGSFLFAGGAGVIADGTTGKACRGGGSGFAVSFARNSTGSATPVAAARDFVRGGGAVGFGSPSSVWTVARTAPEPGAVTVTDGAAFLHTVRLENGRWGVDSGTRCS